MQVFHNHQLVVFAIPKTASTALEAALAPHASVVVQSPPSQRHMNWGAYTSSWAPMLQKAFDVQFEGMAVVREPVERLRSWYRYRATEQFAGTDLSSQGMSFDDFIAATMDKTPPRVARIGAQDKFCMSLTGVVQIKHLFDFAQMPLAIAWLSERLGREIAMDWRNVSPEIDTPLDPSLLERLREARAREFSLYAKVAEAGHLVSDGKRLRF